ncbi:TIGR01459 family HAD-type hydrolase [Bartonella sp. DGB2]|uniref:TIGR01459 family HAD-type hydrolase n=1 Tax=Bartonella sp. DGB2 TaxID=3388426 RepID=UPI00399036C5
MMQELSHISEISDDYEAFFCDIWGVIHNGIAAYTPAVEALRDLRAAGKYVILITNSPSCSADVQEQLHSFAIGAETYDAVVTSGDVTRHIIKATGRRIFFIGAEQNHRLFAGLDVCLVDEAAADSIVCTGPFGEAVFGKAQGNKVSHNGQILDDYRLLFERFIKRDLPFVCANPDLAFDYGGQEMWCAGALAKMYQEMGGRVLIAGKPYTPIYRLAIETLCALGGTDNKARILAIGDGLDTDIKGAADFGINAVFIAAGLHRPHYMHAGRLNRSALMNFVVRAPYVPWAWLWVLQ